VIILITYLLRTIDKNVVDNGTFMYAKHGKLVDADTSAPKPVQNTFNHVYMSFKVTHSGITEKPTRDCVLLYNNVGFGVGNFEVKVWTSTEVFLAHTGAIQIMYKNWYHFI